MVKPKLGTVDADMAATRAYIAPMMDDSPINAAGEGLRFRKMHGLGNDFVVLDARTQALPLTPELVWRAINSTAPEEEPPHEGR